MRCLDAFILLPVMAIVPLIIKNKFFYVPTHLLTRKVFGTPFDSSTPDIIKHDIRIDVFAQEIRSHITPG